MARIITIGRGGTGKTSFVSLVAKRFINNGEQPLLLVDADPDQNLAEMVGVDLTAEGKMTVSDLLSRTFLEEGGTLVGTPPSERIESKIWSDGLYEGHAFDLLAIGTKWVEGCYCLPNAALKQAIKRLSEGYCHTLIDSPAGLEHLNRRITSAVDDIFDVLDPSSKAIRHVERAYKIATEVGVAFHHFYLVGGYRFPDTLADEVSRRTSRRFLGKVAFDADVEDRVLAGRSLLDVHDDSPAYQSVKTIMAVAGYP
jgi:CO dehydrogenase maturation factor